MRKSMWNKLFAVAVICTFFGCKAKKLVQVVHPIPVDSAVLKAADSKVEKLALISSRQINFSSFSGKARAHLSIDANSYDVTMNIRIKKGKQIWVSITAIAGIEVARALITPDSIKVINKLQGIYLKKPFSYVYQYTGKQMSYQTVEAIVVGNAVPEFITSAANMAYDGKNLVFSGIINGLFYQTTFIPGLKVGNLKLVNQQAAQNLIVDNAEFISADGRILPSAISINSSADQKSIKADLHYFKVEFDQMPDMPFKEPKNYTLID